MKNICHKLVFTLLIIGGLNWGLVAIGMFMGTNLDIVNLLLGAWPLAMMAVYMLIGLAALTVLFTHRRDCSQCRAA